MRLDDHEGEPVLVRIFQAEADVAGNAAPQPVACVYRVLSGNGQSLRQLAESILHQASEDLVLCLVIVEERRLRDPDPLGDLAGGHVLGALLEKELLRRREDLAEPFMTRATRLPV